MEQQLRFCTTADGVKLAYATVGEGPPLVKAANWMSHLAYDLESPIWRHWVRELSRYHTYVRYDERGCGLSDWRVEDFSFEAWVRDLETIVDSLHLDRFVLLGISQGGPVSVAYTVRHPERVSHLILYGSVARIPSPSPAEIEEGDALMKLVKAGWGRDNPAYRRLFTSAFVPEGTAEQMRWFDEVQQRSTSPENAVRFMLEFRKMDVLDLLPQVSVPTLVLHAREDAINRLDWGRQIAALIPSARFVQLEGKNHIMLENEPAWSKFLYELRRFVGIEGATIAEAASMSPQGAAQATVQNVISSGFRDLDALLEGGLPEGYRILLLSPSYDERDLLLRRVIRSATSSGQLTLYLTVDLERAKEMAGTFHERFLAMCAARNVPDQPNLSGIPSITNLLEVNVSFVKAIKDLNVEKASPKLLIIDILSDVILVHKSLTSRRWLSDFIAKRKVEGFTIIACMNPLIAPKEEMQTIIDLFDGAIEIFEKETEGRSKRFMAIRKMYARRHSNADLMIDPEQLYL